MKEYAIVLADDHVLIRQTLKAAIEAVSGLKVVGEADDGLTLLRILKELTPELIIVDIFMPHLSGIEAIVEIKQINPAVNILILTMSKSAEHLRRAIAAGVEGYLLKDNAYEDLLAAIKAIRQGKKYISPTLMGESLANRSRLSPLTSREIAVLKLFAQGNDRKEIAKILCVSHSTIITHLSHIKEKLGLNNDIDLIKYALREELISI